MAKVTSKLQVTIPKALADRYGISPGQDVQWLQAGEAIRVVPQGTQRARADEAKRLALFDQATARQRDRESARPLDPRGEGERGWTREELYERDGAG
jgi:bifunctional DNA-binding transcriptional regulator/antitoxin component of YhaV-PrlF toxin-antitoxin module